MPLLGTVNSNASVVLLGIRRMRNAVRGNGQAIRQAWLAIGRLYMAFIRKRFGFASAGSGTWKPLSPYTIRERLRQTIVRKTFGGRGQLGSATRRGNAPTAANVPILIRTGRLFASLGDTSSERVEDFLPDGIREGSRVPYGTYHQTGTKRMPARTILVGPDDAASGKILGRLKQGLTESAIHG